MTRCTGLTATWCPVHGDWCPLHSASSDHGEASTLNASTTGLRIVGVLELLADMGIPEDEALALTRLVQSGSAQQREAVIRLLAYAAGWKGASGL